MSEKSQSGIIRISDDVISIIAGLAALDTPGIASMSGGISEGFAKRMSGKNAKNGVFVEVMESEAAIHLRVIVNYGTMIQDVCRDLQENVRKAVESMTGLRVVEVNVRVESLVVKKELDLLYKEK
ncbi:Asp23/Gls24 family envelope stress response protein [Paenibacillus alginolyticus]|uniref:Alkaline shock protein 23 n=1 Tax=Paenibacillus alginolyticus TaxID=59839 RepID=A0ABT4GIG7_9BACL|nr:Asp23/Gls24 family envelope stress response protein [Paenibacillus alginolyticus]MCY9695916.1 Asp23/Gls24 family envelope stress response protein [Paenibacillus alginolyticus]MEC0146767.1 Asp23/Gls24 family envelope stress response protein [Paenibacillus alginolyticus]